MLTSYCRQKQDALYGRVISVTPLIWLMGYPLLINVYFGATGMAFFRNISRPVLQLLYRAFRLIYEMQIMELFRDIQIK